MTRLGKYELVRKLATGGMAEVFLAKFEWARGLEKTVVVKRILNHLSEDAIFVEQFFTEAQIASQLTHPNIAQIIEFGESEGVYFLSMEYIDGLSLRSLLASAHAKGDSLPFPECARIVAFCCEALTYAHELTDSATGKPLNLVHRDVSPDNILIARTGSVKVVDFGIAKAATQSHQTKTGLVKGKLAYMAPEQLRAEPVDRRADVFSLGVVLYELIAEAKPFEATSEFTLIHAMLYEDMVPLRTRRPDVPPELDRIVNQALQRDRDLRYSDCRAMHADLEDYLISTRQPVSALQLAQLVEKYQPASGTTVGTPPRPMATPSRPPAAKTPGPMRAERTPAPAATAQLRQPLQRTGTDGDHETTGVAEREAPIVAPPHPIEKKEESSSPSGETPGARRPPPRTGRSPALAARLRTPVIAAVAGGVVLLVAAAALLWSSKESQREQPVLTVQEPAERAEVTPSHPSKPEPQVEPIREQPPAPPLPGPKPAPAKPQIELVVRSEPPGMIKVFAGGKVRASQKSPLTTRLPPGPVEIEVSSSGEQSFLKREAVTLASLPRLVEHTMTVGQGTVTFRSFPASNIFVDGILRGEVPLSLKLYEGPHTIRFECVRSIPQCTDGLEPATQTIVVQPGKTSDIRHRW